jgi:hypothetical protein
MKTERFYIGEAYTTKNPLTGDWFVYGHETPQRPPYVCDHKNMALRLTATVDHYARTGETKTFTLKEARGLVVRKLSK